MGTWAHSAAQPLLSYRAHLAENTCPLGVYHAPRRGHVAKVYLAHSAIPAPGQELPQA